MKWLITYRLIKSIRSAGNTVALKETKEVTDIIHKSPDEWWIDKNWYDLSRWDECIILMVYEIKSLPESQGPWEDRS